MSTLPKVVYVPRFSPLEHKLFLVLYELKQLFLAILFGGSFPGLGQFHHMNTLIGINCRQERVPLQISRAFFLYDTYFLWFSALKTPVPLSSPQSQHHLLNSGRLPSCSWLPFFPGSKQAMGYLLSQESLFCIDIQCLKPIV